MAQTPPSGDDSAGPTLSVALLETRDLDGRCLGTFQVSNGLGETLRFLSLELVVLRGETEPGRLFSLALMPVRRDRPSTVTLPMDDRPCAGIERILINRVSACRLDSGPSDACDAAVRGTSETEITLQR